MKVNSKLLQELKKKNVNLDIEKFTQALSLSEKPTTDLLPVAELEGSVKPPVVIQKRDIRTNSLNEKPYAGIQNNCPRPNRSNSFINAELDFASSDLENQRCSSAASSDQVDGRSSSSNFRVRPLSPMRKECHDVEMLSTATSMFWKPENSAFSEVNQFERITQFNAHQSNMEAADIMNQTNINFNFLNKSQLVTNYTNARPSATAGSATRPGTGLSLHQSASQQSISLAAETAIVIDETIYDNISVELLESITGMKEPYFHRIKQFKIRYNTAFDSSLGLVGQMFMNLVELKLNDSIIKSLRDLGISMKNLEVLWISRCQLQDLNGLVAFPSLKEIYASYNNIDDLNPLDFNETVEVVDLEGNDIDNLSSLDILETIDKLNNLNLKSCPISKLPDYQEEVRKKLKKLMILDDQPIHTTMRSLSQNKLRERAISVQSQQQVAEKAVASDAHNPEMLYSRIITAFRESGIFQQGFNQQDQVTSENQENKNPSFLDEQYDSNLLNEIENEIKNEPNEDEVLFFALKQQKHENSDKQANFVKAVQVYNPFTLDVYENGLKVFTKEEQAKDRERQRDSSSDMLQRALDSAASSDQQHQQLIDRRNHMQPPQLRTVKPPSSSFSSNIDLHNQQIGFSNQSIPTRINSSTSVHTGASNDLENTNNNQANISTASGSVSSSNQIIPKRERLSSQQQNALCAMLRQTTPVRRGQNPNNASMTLDQGRLEQEVAGFQRQESQEINQTLSSNPSQKGLSREKVVDSSKTIGGTPKPVVRLRNKSIHQYDNIPKSNGPQEQSGLLMKGLDHSNINQIKEEIANFNIDKMVPQDKSSTGTLNPIYQLRNMRK